MMNSSFLQPAMPLRFARQIPHIALLGAWAIQEDFEWFASRLVLTSVEIEEVDKLAERSRLDWMATRYLIHLFTGSTKRVSGAKDVFGRPYHPGTNYHLSLSHTKGYGAAILSTEATGIDIQSWDHRMHRVAHKFVNEEEQAWIEGPDQDAYQHVLWGAKESLYKAHGRRQLNFLTNLHCEAFEYDDRGGQTEAFISLPSGLTRIFDMHYLPSAETMLVYVIEKPLDIITS